MKLYCSNDKTFVLAEQLWNTSTLYCFSNCTDVFKCEIAGKITGITLNGDTLLCVTECTSEDQNHQKVVLHTFDSALKELSRETVSESSPDYVGIASTIDANYVYVLNYGTTNLTLGFPDEGTDPVNIDAIDQLVFIRINIETKERTKYGLGDTECLDDLWDLTGAYVLDVNSLCISDGRLLIGCITYSPGMEVVPDVEVKYLYGEKELPCFSQTLQLGFDEKKISSSSIHLHNNLENIPLFWFSINEKNVYNTAVLDGKIYLSSYDGMYCIDCNLAGLAVSHWRGSRYDRGKNRYFHIWNDKLVFENRWGNKLTGFLICPASFEEPDGKDWLEVVLQ